MVQLQLEEQIRKKQLELLKDNPAANAGATRVVGDIAENFSAQEALEIYELMEKMNITGANIWLAFNDAADRDLDTMVELIRENSNGLVVTINVSAKPDNKAKLRVS